MAMPTTWTVEIEFTEDEDKTPADAVLRGAPAHLRGWGRVRPQPDGSRHAEHR